jgi:K+-sensing histidine kinase KdpD
MIPPVRQAMIPLGSIALATVLTWVLWPYVQPSSTPLFFVAVMASALYGGVVAGLMTTILSTAVIAVLFAGPPNEPRPLSPVCAAGLSGIPHALGVT